MIIDAHNHLGFRYDLGMSTDDLLRRLDRAGVDKAVCFAQPVVWDNDYVLRAAKEHPDRIIPFAGIDPGQDGGGGRAAVLRAGRPWTQAPPGSGFLLARRTAAGEPAL